MARLEKATFTSWPPVSCSSSRGITDIISTLVLVIVSVTAAGAIASMMSAVSSDVTNQVSLTRVADLALPANLPASLDTLPPPINGTKSLGIFPVIVDADVAEYISEPSDLAATYLTNRLAYFPDARHALVSASLPGITDQIVEAQARGAGFVVYDPEQWDDTPLSEQNDITTWAAGGAVANPIYTASDAVRAAGLKFVYAPDRYFLDMTYDKLDWSRVDMVIIQVQRAPTLAIAEDIVIKTTDVIASQGAATEIFTQFNTKFTSPTETMNRINAVWDRADGFMFVYNDALYKEDLLFVLQNIISAQPQG